jgi:prefoldin subunit 5
MAAINETMITTKNEVENLRAERQRLIDEIASLNSTYEKTRDKNEALLKRYGFSTGQT